MALSFYLRDKAHAPGIFANFRKTVGNLQKNVYNVG